MRTPDEIYERLKILDALYQSEGNKALLLALKNLAWVLRLEYPYKNEKERFAVVSESEKTQVVEKDLAS